MINFTDALKKQQNFVAVKFVAPVIVATDGFLVLKKMSERPAVLLLQSPKKKARVNISLL